MASSSSVPNQHVTLPYWSPEDIDRVLLENAKSLEEWNNLLTKNEQENPIEVTREDISMHNHLKRRLHDNLGCLAKMVQYQVLLSTFIICVY